MLGEIGLTYDKKRDMFYVFKCWKILPDYFGSCKQIKRATKKRPKTLTKQQLCTATSPEELNAREKHFIKLFDATNNPKFYNIAEGGNGGNTHAGWNEQRRAAYSAKISMVTKLRGPRSQITKTKISNTLKGHIVSEETRKKQSNIKRGKIPACAMCRLQPVSLFNAKTSELKTFNSLSDAGRHINRTPSLVSFLQKNPTRTSKDGWQVILNG